MTATPTHAAARRKRRFALVATLALAAAVGPTITPTSAYLTAEQLQPGNTFTTANLTIDDLTSTRDKTGLTTISWKDATTQQWAEANGVNDIHYTATSRTAGGCNVTNTTETSITGQWPVGSDCTISYTYAGWTAAATTTTPSDTISVGSAPIGVAVDPDGKTVYIANSESSYVSAINTATLSVSSIDTPGATGLYGIATSDDPVVCVVGSSSTGGYVAAIGSAVTWHAYTARPLRAVTYSKDASFYSSMSGGRKNKPVFQYIYPTDPRVMTRGVSVMTLGSDAATGIASSNNEIFSTDESSNSLAVTSLVSFSSSTYVVGKSPTGVAVSIGYAYVANSGDDTVSVFDTSTKKVTSTIAVGKNPRAIAVSAEGKSVYVANAGSNTVSVIDTGTNAVVKTLPTGRTPSGIAISPDGGTIYVTNKDDNTVSIIPTGRAETSTSG